MRTLYGAAETNEGTETSDVAQGESEVFRTTPPWPLRIAVLISACVMSLSPHYGKHSLSALAPSLISTLGIRRTQFGLLFSVQEIPGIVLPAVGGMFLSYVRFGLASVVLTLCMVIGQTLCALAIDSPSVGWMLLGRFIFGLGDSLLIMVEYSIVARWLQNSYLSTAFGVMLLTSRLGSFSGLAVPGFVDQNFGLSFAMWFAVFISTVSFFAAIIYALIEKSYWQPTQNSTARRTARPNLLGSLGTALCGLDLSFWLVALLWMLLASPFFSLLDYFTDIFTSQTNATSAHSGLLSGIILGLAAVLSPICGYVVDRMGRRPWVLASSMICLSTGIYLLNYAASTHLAIALISLSFGFGPVTLLSCVALTVPDGLMPMALGFYKAAQNVGLAATHYVAGALRDGTGGYHASLLFFSLTAISGFLVSVILYAMDLSLGGALLKPATA